MSRAIGDTYKRTKILFPSADIIERPISRPGSRRVYPLVVADHSTHPRQIVDVNVRNKRRLSRNYGISREKDAPLVSSFNSFASSRVPLKVEDVGEHQRGVIGHAGVLNPQRGVFEFHVIGRVNPQSLVVPKNVQILKGNVLGAAKSEFAIKHRRGI